jgi:secretion/DNA translocation related TadE-like protein
VTSGRRHPTLASDSGSATILALTFVLVLVLATIVALDFGLVMVGRQRVQAAADLTALGALTSSARLPAELAADIAAANGARLASCACAPEEATVAVELPVRMLPAGPPLRLRARSKAVRPAIALYPSGLPPPPAWWAQRQVARQATAEGPGRAGRDPALGLVHLTARALAADPRLELTARARADLLAGVVDQRLVDLLATLLRDHRLAVSVFRSGHTKFVARTRSVSLHYHGRAADVWKVDGEPVRRGSRPALAVTAWLNRLTGSARPSEVGSPFPQFEPEPGQFSNADHRDHIHLGVG